MHGPGLNYQVSDDLFHTGGAVFYHDDQKGHIVIGEAAVSLAVAGQDITLESLIRELSAMAEGDVSDARLEEIFDARRWLQGLRRYGSREKAERHWMTTAAAGNEG